MSSTAPQSTSALPSGGHSARCTAAKPLQIDLAARYLGAPPQEGGDRQSSSRRGPPRTAWTSVMRRRLAREVRVGLPLGIGFGDAPLAAARLWSVSPQRPECSAFPLATASRSVSRVAHDWRFPVCLQALRIESRLAEPEAHRSISRIGAGLCANHPRAQEIEFLCGQASCHTSRMRKRFPKPRAHVRFMPGALTRRAASRSRWLTGQRSALRLAESMARGGKATVVGVQRKRRSKLAPSHAGGPVHSVCTRSVVVNRA